MAKDERHIILYSFDQTSWHIYYETEKKHIYLSAKEACKIRCELMEDKNWHKATFIVLPFARAI